MKRIASWLGGIFGGSPRQAGASYRRAMAISEELIDGIRTKSPQNDLVCSLFADMWFQRHNVPVMTTLYQTHQEMMSPMGRPSVSPKKIA